MTSNAKIVLKAMTSIAVIGLVVAVAFNVSENAFSQDDGFYEVVVTNLTRGQQFAPIVVATHFGYTKLFTLGSPSSPELAILAEEGNPGPLVAWLKASPEVHDVITTSALLDPGASTRVRVAGVGGGADHVSMAGMLIPTNDGFFALNNVEVGSGIVALTFSSPVYDAGTERNDELCASIPGPFFAECGGPGGGGMPRGGEEGYVHIHAGIHGIGNLSAEKRDWRNPVAQVMIRKVR